MLSTIELQSHDWPPKFPTPTDLDGVSPVEPQLLTIAEVLSTDHPDPDQHPSLTVTKNT